MFRGGHSTNYLNILCHTVEMSRFRGSARTFIFHPLEIRRTIVHTIGSGSNPGSTYQHVVLESDTVEEDEASSKNVVTNCLVFTLTWCCDW